MFKKLTALFLFTCIFSSQAMQAPKFSDFSNLTQESYDQSIAIFSQIPGVAKLLPKKPIINEREQIQFITLISAIMGRSMLGTTTFAFYDAIQTIEPINKDFEKAKNGYLIAVDINTIGQNIKDIFNVTKPTIIYYHNCEEVARSTNFNISNVLEYITKNPFAQGIEIPRFADLKSLIEEAYNQSMVILAQVPFISKLISKKPIIKDELTQVHFLALLGAITSRTMLGTTAVVFYTNAQKIEHLKKFAETQKSLYFIAVDISKIEQEIKNAFNITTEPTIIYYSNGNEVNRNTNFDIKNVVQCIKTISMLTSKLQSFK